MGTEVGTTGWSALGGDVRPRDRMRLFAQMALDQVSAMPRRLRHRLGLREPELARIDVDAMPMPDTAACRHAAEHARTLSEPWLFNHCLRTYAWGALLSQVDRLRFDAELLYVASMLHDLGLTSSHACRAQGCRCFAVEGALAARRLMTDHGWDEARSGRVAEAICLHLNVRVSRRRGHEAHLLHAGAALDVIGARARQLGPQALATVIARHPRSGFGEGMVQAMRQQAELRPRSRAAFLVGNGFLGMIRRCPLDRTVAGGRTAHSADPGDERTH